MAPELDVIAAARGHKHRAARWVALGGVAVAAAVALVVVASRSGSPREPAHTAVVIPLERERLRPYVVAGASSERAATTWLAGRFSAIDVPAGERVRAALDDSRLAVIGPARIEVTGATSEAIELVASGTVVTDARGGRPLVVRAEGVTLRTTSAAFVVAASAHVTVVYVERGEVAVNGHVLHGGDWFGPEAARSVALVALGHEHDHAIAAAGDRAGVLAVEGSGEVAADSGAVLGAAPVWARLPAGHIALTITGDDERHVSVDVRAGEVSRVPVPVPVPVPVSSHKVALTPSPAVREVPRTPEVDPVPPPSPPQDTAATVYARAEAALGRGDRAGAEAMWLDLLARFPTAHETASALYDLANLARARGDRAAAQRYLERLLAAPPAALAEPASYLSCRLAADAGDAEAAAGCFAAFRARFPASPHDAEVLAWLAGRAQAAGGCAAARTLAAEYLRRYPSGAFAARARACEGP
jgi:hypothetical protein